MTDDKINDSKNLTSARALAAIRQMQHCIGVFEAATSAMKAAGQQMLELNAALWDLADEGEKLSITLSEYADAREAYERLEPPGLMLRPGASTLSRHRAAERLREARAKLESLRLFRPHALWNENDPDCPETLKDSNGDVVLGMCKVCSKGEGELPDNGGHCVGGKVNEG